MKLGGSHMMLIVLGLQIKFVNNMLKKFLSLFKPKQTIPDDILSSFLETYHLRNTVPEFKEFLKTYMLYSSDKNENYAIKHEYVMDFFSGSKIRSTIPANGYFTYTTQKELADLICWMEK
jgi:hypothetical protein